MRTRTATPTAHIWLDETGRAWVDDTNVKVIEIALDMLGYGWTAEQIHEAHDGELTMSQILSALSYYHDLKDEFDAEIERLQKEYEVSRAATLDSPGRRKLRALGHIP